MTNLELLHGLNRRHTRLEVAMSALKADLTELQARISFSLACFTFVIIGIPLAIQTQRKETSVGVALTIVIVGLYMLLEAVGRGLKAKAGLYPELIIWAPNILFQTVGFYLFYLANRK